MENGQTQENRYLGYNDLFSRASGIAKRFERMDPNQVYSAMQLAAMDQNPYAHNERVKKISSLPVDYDKDKITEFLKNPDQNEMPLRQTEHALEVSAYPLLKLRKTYQDILTCHSYVYPADYETDTRDSAFMREWKLCEKLRRALNTDMNAHMIAGQVVADGKVFYYPRYKADKSHNRIEYAAMQQLPTDWCKIVGYNSISKYTVAFDLMYFMQPATDWRQFGDLFEPYIDTFSEIAKPEKRRDKKKSVTLFMSRKEADALRTQAGAPRVEMVNGRWFYWVTLPPEKIWTFECDDVWRNVFSPFAGLFLSMEQVSQYEAVQLALVQNPLISVVLGEIPYAENTVAEQHDPYKLSPTGRTYFETLWYQMLAANNTSGVGIYAAPFQNMRLEQLAEAPSATEVSTNGYKYAMLKAGNGLIPMSEEPRVGSISAAQLLEGQFAAGVYRTFERMMDWILGDLGLEWEWRFRMFGNVYTDKDDLKEARDQLAMGYLPAWFRYNALLGQSVLDDISMSKMLDAIKINDLRKPLVTSYNMSAKTQSGDNKGGRPSTDGVTSDGKEAYEETVEEATETTTETTMQT